jgi:hypothetical protein
MQYEELFAMVFVVGMFAGVFIIYMGLRQRSQQLEFDHRERMAMIERGQIPLVAPTGTPQRLAGSSAPSARFLSLGITIVGLGLALMTVISIAGESPESGIGVGGAIAILGGAFIVRSIMVRPESETPRSLPPFDSNRPPFDSNRPGGPVE